MLGEKIGDTIGNLNLGYNAGDTRISDFQILDMLKVIIQELEHYHSYKSMAQDLKNIQTVLKNDW